MPFIKIYIHIVFSTLDRKPFLNSSDLRIKIWKHIKENASKKGIFLDMINGYSDHCHCLISLGSNQNIEKIVQLINYPGASPRGISGTSFFSLMKNHPFFKLFLF